MTEPTTTRPRPRPRPRPKPIASQNSNDASSATPGAQSSSSTTIPLTITGKQFVIEVDNSDEMFMRNTNRSYQTWQNMDRATTQSGKAKEGSSDSENATSPAKNHKNKKVKQESSRTQPHKNNPKYSRLLSEDLSDDSDVELLAESSSKEDKSFGKRKRQQRSRSRSITPPPALPSHQIQTAKNVVRQQLRSTPRPASPTYDPDESTDTIIFQPELTAIAQGLKEQSERLGSQAPEDSGQDNVTVNVKWQRHPLSKAEPKPASEWQMARIDTFRDLFEGVAEDGGILSSNLIMTYQGKRIFPSVTPEILRIWTDSVDLEAYEKTAYEYIHSNAAAIDQPIALPVNINPGGVIEIESDSDSDHDHEGFTAASSPPAQSPSQSQPQTQESDAEPEAEGEKLKLTIQSTIGKDVTLIVRRTTKCGAIVKAFLTKVGVADQYPDVFNPPPPAPAKRGRGRKSKATPAPPSPPPPPPPGKMPQLSIEGEKMDNNAMIGDDVEDGDMIDVVGL